MNYLNKSNKTETEPEFNVSQRWLKNWPLKWSNRYVFSKLNRLIIKICVYLNDWLYYNTQPDDGAILAFKWKIRRTFNKLQSVNDQVSICSRSVSVLLWDVMIFFCFFSSSSKEIRSYCSFFTQLEIPLIRIPCHMGLTSICFLIRIQDVYSFVQDDFFDEVIVMTVFWSKFL